MAVSQHGSMTDGHRPEVGRVRCPTCNARQAWADTCRRCQCDLTLLGSAHAACAGYRRRCLWHLRAGRIAEALRQAHRGHALCPDARSARLLAVCHLLSGNWARAITLAQLAGEE
ncbi:MAG: hypothetical protein ABIP48_01860 [Planctomycetota bacterium]